MADTKSRRVKTAKPKESLVDWLLRTTPAPVPSTPKPIRTDPSHTPGIARYVPLTVWAEQVFGEHAPHYNTLLRWAHEGRIQPQAKKIGRKWWVVPSAEYVSD